MRTYLLRGFGISLLLALAESCGSTDNPGDSASTGSTGSTGSAGAGGGAGSTSAASAASTTGGPDASDGRYHPPGDGKRISEISACDLLSTGQGLRKNALSCAGTSVPCPDLLRSEFMIPCLEYDQGSVQGCIDHYFAATTCQGLSKSIAECVITAFPGSQPNGCPTQ